MTAVKTAVSVPADLFSRWDAVALELGRSRSSVLVEALQQYLESRREEELQREFNEAFTDAELAGGAAELAPFQLAAARAIDREDW
jgi:predicted transcriptional regulator